MRLLIALALIVALYGSVGYIEYEDSCRNNPNLMGCGDPYYN